MTMKKGIIPRAGLQMIQITRLIFIQIPVWILVYRRRVFIHPDNLGKCGHLQFPVEYRLEEILGKGTVF